MRHVLWDSWALTCWLELESLFHESKLTLYYYDFALKQSQENNAPLITYPGKASSVLRI
jgi:hypothetical protein